MPTIQASLASLILTVQALAAIIPAVPPTVPTIEQLVEKHGSDLATSTRETMVKIIHCESGGNPLAVGKAGERGLVQIHPPSHPHVTPEQAFDPDFAVQFLAEAFREGNENWWSCLKLI